MIRRCALWLSLLSVGGLAVFCLRFRQVCVVIALSDALFFGGFFALGLSVASEEAFDGFAYAAACALAGLFPGRQCTYQDFKGSRAQRRQAENGGAGMSFFCVLGAIFLAVGCALCVAAM